MKLLKALIKGISSPSLACNDAVGEVRFCGVELSVMDRLLGFWGVEASGL